jgi:hypothetical protein
MEWAIYVHVVPDNVKAEYSMGPSVTFSIVKILVWRPESFTGELVNIDIF